MNFETLVRKIKSVRHHFLRHLGSEIITTVDHSESGLNALSLMKALMDLPVSKKSRVKDSVWDFDDGTTALARDIQGAKSRIDFAAYTSLNATILFEIKMAMLCVLEIPGALRIRASPKSYKPHTILDIFKSTIPFFDQMSERKRLEQGEDFFENSYFSLSDFTENDYEIEARLFKRSFRSATMQGFNILRSDFMLENVLAGPLAHVELESLSWQSNRLNNKETRKKLKWLPNKVFEKCTRAASFAVVDFLKALQENIADTETLNRVNLTSYEEAKKVKLTRRSYDIYVSVRMGSRGYSGRQIIPFLYKMDQNYWSPLMPGQFKDKEAITKLTNTQLNNEFYEYITHINNSAIYTITQYTGMRPSELAGCLAEDCLTRDVFGHWLIVSTVFKGREAYGNLFEDKWVAIPAVLDAVKALRILNRFKQNPFLITNMNTIKPSKQEEANSVSGCGLGHQLQAFLMKVLTLEEFESLDFSPYTLRHSLANQMFRAAVGLPFISYQLKHFGHLVSKVEQRHRKTVTVDYGGIGDALVSGGGRDAPARFDAEREFIVNACDPDGGYAGDNADAHRSRLAAYFKGYLEAGYSKDEIFDRMAEMNFAVINVGQGYCYGGASEEHDASLPCIGSLRCNPNRCKNAVVTEANAPKWLEVYIQNSLALKKIEGDSTEPYPDLRASGEVADSIAQLKLAISEAEGVLRKLGREVSI
ncbi:site-specific integrase [Pseudomonas asiatica]|uniref:site-specific integrase n=1 Tax=Pseudomonas TaxID=286 RepID=UPI0015708B97|nr:MULTISPECIES: site-specific integrase [Pseudomonas]MDD2077428.1 site-specific integrase [Pseudomonas putida]QKL04051.1 site-specific integrase [Pseudomonas sp. NY5710]QNT40622.1 site-specific integrase [Pseudomonas asiatica]HDS1694665.1 site-specific integrase [Pseudomonas putida]